MPYQPKVNNTQKYEDSQGSHVVTTGKLVFLNSSAKEIVSKITNGGSWLRFCVETGSYKLPLIISETEEIKEGDWVLDELELNIFQWDSEAEEKFDKIHYYKILALPEHFSDKHLQAIVDGKMKDGDVVYLKVEPV